MGTKLIATAALALLPALASAGETATYSYDAKGRLIKVEHAGGRNAGLVSTYAFDAADNRTGTEVKGARANVIVVPLGGLQLIPVR